MASVWGEFSLRKTLLRGAYPKTSKGEPLVLGSTKIPPKRKTQNNLLVSPYHQAHPCVTELSVGHARIGLHPSPEA